jgi:hypothetical protein
MEVQMKSQDESSSDETGRSGWQLLGQIDLSTGSDTGRIHTWLVELLTPLNLHLDFVNQLLNSARDAIARALHWNAEFPLEHLHLSMFAPNERNSQRKTWGFFRIEKIDSGEPNKDHLDYVVEFYLYLEG